MELSKAIEVVRDRLYYVALRAHPHERADAHYFTIDDELNYWPFFLDYGPLSLGCLYRFSQIMSAKLTDASLAGRRIYLYSSPHMHKRHNAVYLMAAYTMLYLGRTPEEAYRPFALIAPPLAPWHDASPTVDTFHLTTLDVLRGIAKARDCRFFSFDAFDCEEYEYYEKVEHGDMNWLAYGRFLAFAGPHDTRMSSPEGYHTTAVEDVIPYFKHKGVGAVVRLNKKYYNEKRFTNVGIDHHDMYYLDGSNPPDHILARFLQVCEGTPGELAGRYGGYGGGAAAAEGRWAAGRWQL
jgi:cell division cycle 14